MLSLRSHPPILPTSQLLTIRTATSIGVLLHILVLTAQAGQGLRVQFEATKWAKSQTSPFFACQTSPPPSAFLSNRLALANSVAPSASVPTAKPYGSSLFGKPAFRRNVWQDMKFIGKSGVSDVAWLYSSPARIKPRALLYFAGIVAVGTGIYFFDDEISSGLHRNKDHWFIEPFHETGEFLEPIGRQGTMNKYFFGSAVLSYLVGFEWLSRVSAEILESYLIAGPPKVAVNKLSGRPRPMEGYKSTHWDFFEPGQSFFSGHASHAFQIARIMDEHVHFVPADVLFYFGAASMGLQRIDSEWHWASDVWAGSAYGFVVADALMGRHRLKWLSVLPYSGTSGTTGLWLSVNF